jgi:hypothetical protein
VRYACDSPWLVRIGNGDGRTRDSAAASLFYTPSVGMMEEVFRRPRPLPAARRLERNPCGSICCARCPHAEPRSINACLMLGRHAQLRFYRLSTAHARP